MNNQLAPHLDEKTLLLHADGEMEAAEVAKVDAHLLQCEACRDRADQLYANLGELAASIRSFKESAPAPPREWEDLSPRFARIDAEPHVTPMPVRSRSRSWIGIAAAIVMAVIAWRLPFERTVSAAELLERASVAKAKPEAQRRIRIKTRRSTVVRPARIAGADSRMVAASNEASELRVLFEQAGFSWDDPLSARSFAAWRNSLPEKKDEVVAFTQSEGGSGRYYRIRTTTGHGLLQEASLTLRASDLYAVHETLQFRGDERIEISEAAGAVGSGEQERRDPPLIASEPQPPAKSVPAGPAEELRVLAALSSIGADLGEPVEVGRGEDGRISVHAVGLDSRRERQIRDALARLPEVSLTFERVQPLDTAAGRAAVAPSIAEARPPLYDRLEKRLGTNSVEAFVDRLLGESEAVLARAHALRKLTARFPPAVAASLNSDDAALLRSMQRRHLDAIVGVAGSIDVHMMRLLGGVSVDGQSVCSDWQQCSGALAAAAQRLDQTLNTSLAGGQSASAPEAEISEAYTRWVHDLRAIRRFSEAEAR